MGAIPCLPACLRQNLLVVYSRILQTSRLAGTALGVSGNSLVSATPTPPPPVSAH